jgi:hypothetical protein
MFWRALLLKPAVSSSAAMFSGFRLRHAELRMLAAAPVDHEDNLTRKQR